MKCLIACLSLFMFFNTRAQVPLSVYRSKDQGKPLILYLSGDGGWNSFSTGLLQQFNKMGYPVLGVNSKSYFWKKKKPQEAANELGKVLAQYKNSWKVNEVVLIGYSFGADVMPFIQTRLAKALTDSIRNTVLISPSRTTDFEIHLLGMMGFKEDNGMSVPNEIRKLSNAITIIYGSDENDISLKELTGKDVRMVKLPGGHHYDGNTQEVAATIVRSIR